MDQVNLLQDAELLRPEMELESYTRERLCDLSGDDQQLATDGGRFELEEYEDQLEKEEQERRSKNKSETDFMEKLLKSTEEAESDEKEERTSRDKCIRMAINGSDAEASGEDASMEGAPVREGNEEMNASDMCYDSVVHPLLPPEGIASVQESELDYRPAFMDSLREREGMLITPEQACPSSTFFQTGSMHVPSGNALAGSEPSWVELNSTQEESEYDACALAFDSTKERAPGVSFCKKPKKDISLDSGKNSNLPGSAYDDDHGKHARLQNSHSPECTDMEEPLSSVLCTETTNHAEGKETTCPTPMQREKAPLIELCLRNVLSDPITGQFLDDAMVSQCGHSFGGGSLQQVMETHVCMICGANVLRNTLVPNLALRAAVLAYKHEEQWLHMGSMGGTKRRRDSFEQAPDSEGKKIERDHLGSGENTCADMARVKGVQFPFAVSDKVLIKGNKRTPERFVGREAVITNQCLNGWYLVRTMDSGESVRLQYRSLQKLGETEFPSTSERVYFAEQCGDASGSPEGVGSFKEFPSCSKTLPELGLKSGSFVSQEDVASDTIAFCSTPVTVIRAGSVEGDTRLALDKFASSAHGGGTSSLLCSATSTNQELLINQGGAFVSKTSVSKEAVVMTSREQVDGRDGVKVSDESGKSKSVLEIVKDNLPMRINTLLNEPANGHLPQNRLQSDSVAEVWIGAKIDLLETGELNSGQVSPSNILSTDTIEEVPEIGEMPTGVKDQENGNESLRTRSRRSALHSKNLGPFGGFLRDSDPYRKVYNSGPRRRGGKGDALVMLEHAPAESKSVLKCSNDSGQGSAKTQAESLHGGVSGGVKQGRDIKSKSTNEILQIMRKDMLKLEKRIPQNYLLPKWMSDRVNWRKGVKGSRTVLELGALVREFRYSLLLAMAGGMSDDELEMRIATIIESGDVELLVSLWGRLYDDVYKWLELKLKRGLKASEMENLSTDDPKHLRKFYPNLVGQQISAVHLTTVATLVAAEAVGEGHQDPEAGIKTLIASTVKLLQQQSRMELLVVKEALDREKRHITAKLATLEERYAKLVDASDLLKLESEPCLISPGRRTEGGHGAHEPSSPLSQGGSCAPAITSKVYDETDEGESDGGVLLAQDPDGEATDMSDSD